MTRNVGKLDQALRIGFGLMVLLLGLVYQNLWGLLGLIPLLTGLVGRCPLYAAFGWSTCSTPAPRADPAAP